LRRNSRWVLTMLGGLFGAGFLAPSVQFALQRWSEAHGYQLLLLKHTAPAMAKLADVSQTAAFVFAAGFVIGGALLLWIDHTLRRRTQDMGLILAGIGLATFAVGIGIYFFPLPMGAQSATNTPPSAVPPMRAGEPLVWSKTPILGSSKQADGTIYARTFGVVGKNVGREDVQLDDVYIVSGINGARVDLKVQIPDEGSFPAKETNPIPADAFIQLSSDEFNSSGGISELDFLRDWGAINFFAEYGGQKHRVIFDRATIAALFDAQRPKSVPPHVSRKAAPVTEAIVAVPPPAPAAEAAQGSAPSAADMRKRRRDLLRDYAEMINGPLVAAVRQGRQICDDWNALGGLSTQQFYDQVTAFKNATTEALVRFGDLRRKYQLEDADIPGLTDWNFDKIVETSDALMNELRPLFLLDIKEAREALINNGSFAAWYDAINDFDRWIAARRKLVADKIKDSDVAEAGSDGAK